MTVTFPDLHSEAGLKTLEEFLRGDHISKDDVKVFAAVAKPGDGFPYVCRWYDSIAAVLATRFPGEAVGVKIGGQAAEVSRGEDDDDLDLW